MPTYKDKDLREAVALEKARAKTVSEALADPQKQQVFNRYYRQVPMAGHYNGTGQYIKGIEDEIPKSQYQRDAHQTAVVTDILENWITLSQNSKFHALLATSSITEAIEYYRRFKTAQPDLKVTALFDPNIDYDSNGDLSFKQAGLVEILADYNQRYGQNFDLAAHGRFKKDIAARLAHKRPYGRIKKEPENQIDLLIVVDQMLTGFDSKWLNTLYLDKVLKYENIIQAFSRTNRLFGPDKPFGTIRYYRYPHTMERNINEAVKLYSGDKPLGLFADRLEANLEALNTIYDDIAALFTHAGIDNFEKLPDEVSERAQFAQWFKQFNNHLEAAKIQSFTWKELSYTFDKDKHETTVTLNLDETTYLILALRYKELASGGDGGVGLGSIPFDIDGYLTEIDTGVIDADYMNSRFEKYLKTLQQTSIDPDHQQKTLNELHKSFASLSQEEQKYANIFLNEVQRGDISLTTGKTFRDYITEYQSKGKNAQITAISQALGLDKDKLIYLMNAGVNATNLNEYGRFDDLKNTVDKVKAKAYLEKRDGVTIPTFKINLKIDQLLQDFILQGGFDLK